MSFWLGIVKILSKLSKETQLMEASISMSFCTLFSTGGCVEKRFPIVLPEIAGIIKNAFNPSTCLKSFVGTRRILPLIFIKALASLTGFPVIWAAPLSAENSLYLEIALIIRKLIIHTKTAT